MKYTFLKWISSVTSLTIHKTLTVKNVNNNEVYTYANGIPLRVCQLLKSMVLKVGAVKVR